MALGTIDSINYLKSGIESGTINVVETANGWQVSGDTYQVKEYLKRDFGARWDKDAQAWNIAIDDHYEGGRDSYHYGIFADACKQAKPEQPETTDAETTEYAQLMEWQDEDGNAISYELDYGDEETGFDSIAYSGTLESVIDEIERDGWRYCPADDFGAVWQLYQQEIDGMEGLGARAVCCAVFER